MHWRVELVRMHWTFTSLQPHSYIPSPGLNYGLECVCVRGRATSSGEFLEFTHRLPTSTHPLPGHVVAHIGSQVG